jgi:hypothetical protein
VGQQRRGRHPVEGSHADHRSDLQLLFAARSRRYLESGGQHHRRYEVRHRTLRFARQCARGWWGSPTAPATSDTDRRHTPSTANRRLGVAR